MASNLNLSINLSKKSTSTQLLLECLLRLIMSSIFYNRRLRMVNCRIISPEEDITEGFDVIINFQ